MHREKTEMAVLEEPQKKGQSCWGRKNPGQSGGRRHREVPGDLRAGPQVGVRIPLTLTLCKAEMMPQGQEPGQPRM